MDLERWQNIIGRLKDSFKVEEEGEEHSDEAGGTEEKLIIFHGPLGRMKLALIVKPVVLGKKTTYSRRIGASTAVEYLYGEEKTCKLKAYLWEEKEGEWREIEAGSFA